MACFRPLSAQRLDSGAIHFGADRGGRPLTLPCGKCIGCRIQRTQSWALRIAHEASLYKSNSFITLTYNNQHLTSSLDYSDFQRFMYRLRKLKGPTRFFAAGEYGSTTQRPHWHAILFSCSFPDLTKIGKSLYTSSQLNQLWPFGFSSIGDVTLQSAAYVAKYATKKVTGPRAAGHYTRLDPSTGELLEVAPEMARMSLKPGIGARWLEKYYPEVYVARDGVVLHGGREVKPPRYYDQLMAKIDWSTMEAKEKDRYERAARSLQDSTPARLRDREVCAYAALRRKKEKLL